MDDLAALRVQTQFSSHWWDQYLAASQFQTQPTVMRGALSLNDQALYTQGVLEILRVLGRLRTVSFGFRIFVEGRQYSLDEMTDMFDRMPLDGETLEAWSSRVFGGRGFGIIINTGEKFELGLAASIAEKLAPLFKKIGYPRDGVNFSIFIGNYDRTPLGIHQDTRGESVMHFHLGPARKQMYLWSPETYERLRSSGLSRRDPETMKPHAKMYDFGPGDLFYMPEGTWHVGEQEGLSIGITVWQYNHTNYQVAANLHKFVHKTLFAKGDPRIQSDASCTTSSDGLDCMFTENPVPEEYRSFTYEQLLRELYVEWRHVLRSNGGYRTLHFPMVAGFEVDPSQTVRAIQPFELLTRSFSDYGRMQLYCRGHRIELRDFPSVRRVVDRINTGRDVKVEELVRIASPEMPSPAVLYILSQLVRFHGISRVTTQSGGERSCH